jgi:predicted esterase
MKINMAFIIVALCLTGCTHQMGDGHKRLHKAQKIAQKSALQEEVIRTSHYDLKAFGRVQAQGEPLVVFIEGDGLAWRNRRVPSEDPSPTDPIALRLATIDKSPNVLYLARPCQYVSDTRCNVTHWTSHRYEDAVIEAHHQAIQNYMNRHNLKGVRLVGFSGGGAVAALLASRRNDVIDLRTVAGNLDIQAHSDWHGVSQLSGSLNPVDYASRLAHVPQIHYIGGKDKVVPAQIYQSYALRLALHQIREKCTQSVVVTKASHEKGWEEAWGQHQSTRPQCYAHAS